MLGTEFELGDLERMLGVSGDELLDTMELAVRERVLGESPVSIGRFAFAHALIRETIYEQLSATRRARLHLRAGAALEALHADELDDYAEQLTHHFVEGGDEATSFEHRQRAARAAARVYAAQTAVAHYDAGLETGRRLGLSPESDARIRRMLVERAWLRHVCGDVEAGLADYTVALQAARAAGDARVEAEALDGMAFADKLSDVQRAESQHRAALAVAERLADAQLQIRIISRLSLLLSNQLDLEGALELGERALALSRVDGDSHDRALAIDALKLVALQLGESDRLRELTSELEDIERRRGELWYLQWTLFESAFVPLARAQWDARPHDSPRPGR